MKLPRPLREEERALITSLLLRTGAAAFTKVPTDARVIDMEDGGMGSIRFTSSTPRRFGKEIAKGEYRDSDGIPVSISLNTDEGGDLLELDVWKVDFSPLKRYPRPPDVIVSGDAAPH